MKPVVVTSLAFTCCRSNTISVMRLVFHGIMLGFANRNFPCHLSDHIYGMRVASPSNGVAYQSLASERVLCRTGSAAL